MTTTDTLQLPLLLITLPMHMCYDFSLMLCTLYITLNKWIPCTYDSIKDLIFFTFHYLIISFTVSMWSSTRSLLRALEVEWNRVRSKKFYSLGSL